MTVNTIPPTPATLSIALCTYNGAAYLPQQWESLLAQERQPDEVIICDDGSTDGTRPLLHRLAAQAPFRVEIIENPVRLGFDRNFEQAISRCTGDLIFICDQDDWWFPQKLRVMADYMNAHPTAEIAFNNAWMADEHLHKSDKLCWNLLRFNAVDQQRWIAGKAMEVLLDGPRVMGCATVLRQRLVPQLLPIPLTIPTYNYDGWISLVGAALDVIHFVDEPLQLYRIHENQQISLREGQPVPRTRLRERFTRGRMVKLEPLIQKKTELATIQQLLAQHALTHASGMAQVRQKLVHYTARAEMPANWLSRIRPVWHELQRGAYHYYVDPSGNRYRPYITALGDLFE